VARFGLHANSLEYLEMNMITCYPYSLPQPSHEIKDCSWKQSPRRDRGHLCTKTRNQICQTCASKKLLR